MKHICGQGNVIRNYPTVICSLCRSKESLNIFISREDDIDWLIVFDEEEDYPYIVWE